MAAQPPYPRQVKLHFPLGGFLTATRRRNEDPHDELAVYEIHCIGQDSVLRTFIDTRDSAELRAKLREIIGLPADNPSFCLFKAMRHRRPLADESYILSTDEAAAIIIQSRALCNGDETTKRKCCQLCKETTVRHGFPTPFPHCASIPKSLSDSTCCGNCSWSVHICSPLFKYSEETDLDESESDSREQSSTLGWDPDDPDMHGEI